MKQGRFARRWFCLAAAFMLIFILNGCTAVNPQAAQKYAVRRYAEGDLSLNTAGGKLEAFYDDHGGFHGDGKTFLEIHFDDSHMTGSMIQSGHWKPLPVDRDVRFWRMA